MVLNDNQGVAATPPGHSDEPASSLAATAGSVPNAGEIGLADISMFRDAYRVVRVVKAGALGKMWQVETFRQAVLSTPARWEGPLRRKVNVWMPLGDSDPAEADRMAREKVDTLYRQQRDLTAAHHQDVKRAAQAMSAGTAKTA